MLRVQALPHFKHVLKGRALEFRCGGLNLARRGLDLGRPVRISLNGRRQSTVGGNQTGFNGLAPRVECLFLDFQPRFFRRAQRKPPVEQVMKIRRCWL